MKIKKKYKLFVDKYYCSQYDFSIDIIVYTDYDSMIAYTRKKGINNPQMTKCAGVTYLSDDSEYVLILDAEYLNLNTVVHESIHVGQLVLMSCNMYDEDEDPNMKSKTTLEVEAYLYSSIFTEINGRVKKLYRNGQSHVTRLVPIKKS